MEYEKTVEFAGDRRKAIEIAQQAFLNAGFMIEDTSDSRIRARYDGPFIGTRSGNGMWAASPIEINVSDRRITVTADYPGVAKTRRFILRLLCGLAICFAVVFGLMYVLNPHKYPPLVLFGVPAGVLLIQLPIFLLVMPAAIKSRAESALDALTQNMAVLARRQ